MNHHLNKHYRELQETAERHYREDLEAWQYKDEIMERALANASHSSFTHNQHAPCEKQPVSPAKEKQQEDEKRSAEAECELYENYRANEDANEYEVNQK